MAKNRMFRNEPTRNIVVRIEQRTVDAIDRYYHGIGRGHPGNRSEFVRQAVEAHLKCVTMQQLTDLLAVKKGSKEPRGSGTQ